MIVVDTNILAYLWIQGEATADVEALLAVDDEWCAPLLWRSEFRNLLVGYMRRGDMSLQTARTIAAEAERLMTGREYAVAASDVLRLASESPCSAYDCECVALAAQLQVPLVTRDREILAAFPKTARRP